MNIKKRIFSGLLGVGLLTALFTGGQAVTTTENAEAATYSSCYRLDLFNVRCYGTVNQYEAISGKINGWYTKRATINQCPWYSGLSLNRCVSNLYAYEGRF